MIKGVSIEAFKSIPTPLGAVGLTAGFGVDPTSAIDRAGNLSSLSPGLQVTVDLDAPVVDDITITLDPDSDTGILLDNAGFNTTPTFVVSDPVSGLTPTDSLVLFYALRPNSQDPGSGLNGVAKRYAALSIDDAASESLVGTGFDENADGVWEAGEYANIQINDQKIKHTPIASNDEGCVCLTITERDVIFFGKFGSFLNLFTFIKSFFK